MPCTGVHCAHMCFIKDAALCLRCVWILAAGCCIHSVIPGYHLSVYTLLRRRLLFCRLPVTYIEGRGTGFAAVLFTALHGMQTRSYDENSVLSVRPSVCRLSNACIVTKRKKDIFIFLHHTKDHVSYFSEKNGSSEKKFWVNHPVGVKSLIFNQ